MRPFRAAAFVLVLALATDLSAQPEEMPRQPDEAATPMMMQMPRMPQVAMQVVPSYGQAPLTVGFLISFPDPAIQFESFRWNFGDGQVSTMPPLMLFHTYVRPGSYVVMLTATSTEGMSATAMAGVVVRPSGLQ